MNVLTKYGRIWLHQGESRQYQSLSLRDQDSKILLSYDPISILHLEFDTCVTVTEIMLRKST